jgi:hypothetical protein
LPSPAALVRGLSRRYLPDMQRSTSNRERAVVAIYVAAFAIGACNHARDFAAGGWRPYSWTPWPLEAFWSALIVLDTLAIVLLLRWRQVGLLLAVMIMLADVAINSYAAVALDLPGFPAALVLQSLFLGFVLGSTPFVWPRRSASRNRQP